MTAQAETQNTASSLAARQFAPWSYGILVASVDSLEKLSKIGSKNKAIIKRLAKMLRYARTAADIFYLQRDTLMNNYAARDDEGAIKIATVDAEKGVQRVIFTNEPEYQLKLNELMRAPADVEGLDRPEPFTWDDVMSKFGKTPDPSLLALLGPFVDLDSKLTGDVDD